MKQHNVFPECNVDTNLVGFILGGYAKHKSSCNEVVKAVNHAAGFAVGVIDADKRQATMDSGFEEYKLDENVDGERRHIAMFVHQDGRRFMFTVKPAMDKFILDAAAVQHVDLRKAGFPTTLEGFKKVTKRIQAADDHDLRKLFGMIAGYDELQRFRNTLKYLMTKQYDVDVDTAKRFFKGDLSSDDLAVYLTR